MNKKEPHTLASLIRAVMADEGLTLEAIARRSGLPIATIGAWSTGTRGAKRPPSADLLRKLARGLRLPEADVFAAAGREHTPGAADDASSKKWAALGRDLSPEDRAIAEAMLRAFRRERGY